ncbi:MAG TPA: reductive dehalogenase domain-containing protein [Spirochaetota bacterium]|nr:reductive dehalogenase domain-containing protein [Spirochaetota bacterium]HPS85845.1 reductive dehalogenase domain-containing protein [Spirochaetota bacterium]
MNHKKKYILIGLWSLTGISVIWFFLAGLSIYAFLTFFVLFAASFIAWGLSGKITDKMRGRAIHGINAFWIIMAFLFLFPFPVPERPEYVVGEIHRFSEPNHGWGRALLGALGPNLFNNGLAYNTPEEIKGLVEIGAIPSVLTSFPFARTTFGGTAMLNAYRDNVSHGGEPAVTMPYPWTTWKGAKRENRIGWNKGDILLGDVAHEVGYEKAKYTPRENSLMIKEIGKWLGSMTVGICKVDPRWFYSHDFMSMGTPLDLKDVKNFKYAIQLFTDQNWKRVHNDPGHSWWSITKSGQAYSTSAWMAVRMGQMLRDMGYLGRVGYGGINYDTIESPFSVYNGLGEYGRLSDAVVPSAGGLRFKSATVLTDFPLEPDNSNQGHGITRFCEHCDRCARACPVNAIPQGDMTVENGVKMWHVDKDKCVRFRAGNLDGSCCNECLRNCPYNKPDTLFHKLGVYITRHSYLAPYLFGNVRAIGLEDWLDFETSNQAGKYNVNRPARWIQEEPGFKMKLPYVIGKYVFTEGDRSTSEEWSTGVGAEMGKIGLKYKGVEWGKIPANLLDKNGRNRNAHWDYENGELPKNLQCMGKYMPIEEVTKLLKAGKLFTGDWYTKDEDVYPPRSEKYEKGLLKYEDAVKMWEKE